LQVFARGRVFSYMTQVMTRRCRKSGPGTGT
jgi:hypothetical protein